MNKIKLDNFGLEHYSTKEIGDARHLVTEEQEDQEWSRLQTKLGGEWPLK